MPYRHKNHGFTHLWLFLVIILLVVGGVGWRMYWSQKNKGALYTTFSPAANQALLNDKLSHGKCQGSGTREFSAAPMRAQDLAYVVPLGAMVKGHVTPIDHQYFYPNGYYQRDQAPEVPIYAPADGTIVNVSRAPLQQVEKHLQPRDGYDIVIEYSCDFYSRLGLLTGITDDLSQKLGPIDRGGSKDVRIPVKAGQQVARVGGQSLDLFTYDANTPAKHWIVPAHYNESDGTKKLTTDAFLYFTPELQAELLAKNPRLATPRGGKIDYDVDGRLVGTWFLQGTGGYSGGDQKAHDYWKGHLVFVYDVLDPGSLEISMGSWAGGTEGYQFAVIGNTPDPQTISAASGLVKYELTNSFAVKQGGQRWDQLVYEGPIHEAANDQTEGVVLVQLVNDRLIKVEKFPGKTASQVNGFGSGVELYER